MAAPYRAEQDVGGCWVIRGPGRVDPIPGLRFYEDANAAACLAEAMSWAYRDLERHGRLPEQQQSRR